MSPFLMNEKGDDTIMYTKGIKKIFVARDAGMPLDRAVIMATEAGFTALSFNGVIYIKSVDCWVDTVFHISDFSDAND
jgi:hypothetical protein